MTDIFKKLVSTLFLIKIKSNFVCTILVLSYEFEMSRHLHLTTESSTTNQAPLSKTKYVR